MVLGADFGDCLRAGTAGSGAEQLVAVLGASGGRSTGGGWLRNWPAALGEASADKTGEGERCACI